MIPGSYASKIGFPISLNNMEKLTNISCATTSSVEAHHNPIGKPEAAEPTSPARRGRAPRPVVDETGRTFRTMHEAAKFYNCNVALVSLVANGHLPSWRGHVFRLVDGPPRVVERPHSPAALAGLASLVVGRQVTIADLICLIRANPAFRESLRQALGQFVVEDRR